MAVRHPRLLLATVSIGLVLSSIHAITLVRFRTGLHEEIRHTIVGRAAAVLLPVARQQIINTETRSTGTRLNTDELLAAILPSAQQEDMLSVAVFDPQGALLRALPGNLLFAELSASDYFTLLKGASVSRFHPQLPLDRYFSGAAPAATAPVLEVILPLEGRSAGLPLGFAQYYIDARGLGDELAVIESRMHRQTWATLGIGTGLIMLVLAGAFFGLRRAHHLLDERNQRLVRANLELTLSSKTSALGQLTSHLIHGLQGSVAELRTIMHTTTRDPEDWATATHHTNRIQTLISEIIELLGDAQSGGGHELTGDELCAQILQRNKTTATTRGVALHMSSQFHGRIDGHTGGILCLIATNLVENSLKVSSAGQSITIMIASTYTKILLTVSDQGPGIPESIRARLFEPGASGCTNGSGLGLSISRLLARQLRGEIELVSTNATGTTFRVCLPAKSASLSGLA